MARGTPREPYQGIQFDRVHPLIGNLAIKPEGGTDWKFVLACSGRINLDDLLDMAWGLTPP